MFSYVGEIGGWPWLLLFLLVIRHKSESSFGSDLRTCFFNSKGVLDYCLHKFSFFWIELGQTSSGQKIALRPRGRIKLIRSSLKNLIDVSHSPHLEH